MSVFYLVSATADRGVREAREHEGWVEIAYGRFVTPGKHEVRVISKASELHPFAGATPMIRGGDYEEGPPAGKDGKRFGLDVWVKQRLEFERFVDDGNGEWVDAP